MAKRIVGFVPIGDGTRDRGETLKVFELHNDRIDMITTNKLGIKTGVSDNFFLTDIEIDCFKHSATRNESVEGAVIGGLAFGLAGAVIGGLAGLKVDAWYCEIIRGNERLLFRFNSELDKNALLKWYNIYK